MFFHRNVDFVHELCSVNRGHNAFTKRVDPCQPAQSVQADVGRSSLLSTKFPFGKGPFYHD